LTYGAGAVFVTGWAEELEADPRSRIRVPAAALMTWASLLIAFPPYGSVVDIWYDVLRSEVDSEK
jgi:hypothetical protein